MFATLSSVAWLRRCASRPTGALLSGSRPLWKTIGILFALALVESYFVYLQIPAPRPLQRVSPPLWRSTGYIRLVSNESIGSPFVSVSLVQRSSSLISIDSEQQLIVVPDPSLRRRIIAGVPIDDPEDNQLRSRLVAWLRNRCDSLKLSRFKPLIVDSEQSLVDLTQQHSDVVAALMPVSEETIKADERAICWHWITRYTGQWRPRLRFRVENPTNQMLRIQKLYVTVTDVSIGRGVPLSEAIPIVSLQMPDKKGKFAYQMSALGLTSASCTIGGNSIKEFDIALASRKSRSGQAKAIAWQGAFSLLSNFGEIRSSPFSISTYPY